MYFIAYCPFPSFSTDTKSCSVLMRICITTKLSDKYAIL
ncbi:hypothetical protein PARMER_00124 [Parabacteroides merdae ATCC 43184]|nr:hypothetical protein PARMER_00124 [Parabacteroides merdae ATCC 43184]